LNAFKLYISLVFRQSTFDSWVSSSLNALESSNFNVEKIVGVFMGKEIEWKRKCVRIGHGDKTIDENGTKVLRRLRSL